MTADHPPPEAFFEVHRGLPRQGVGSDEQTLHALALCPDLPPRPDVLDVGCGPGRQTLALAGAIDGRITAVDLHEPFLEELRGRAMAAGLGERIEIVRADMAALPFETSSFDLIWSEGAAYIMGVEAALAAWRRFLRPGGCVVISELVWTDPEPSAEVLDFFGAAYPPMTDVAGTLGRVREAGYEVVGHFMLPDRAWWDEYLGPPEARLPALRQRYAEDAAALAVVEATRSEIDLRRRYPGAYGYAFVVARAPRPAAANPSIVPPR